MFLTITLNAYGIVTNSGAVVSQVAVLEHSNTGCVGAVETVEQAYGLFTSTASKPSIGENGRPY